MKVKIFIVFLVAILTSVGFLYKKNISLIASSAVLEQSLTNAVGSIDSLLTEKNEIDVAVIKNIDAKEKSRDRVELLQKELKRIRENENDKCGESTIPSNIAGRL